MPSGLPNTVGPAHQPVIGLVGAWTFGKSVLPPLKGSRTLGCEGESSQGDLGAAL